jgi:hypothetical protein
MEAIRGKEMKITKADILSRTTVIEGTLSTLPFSRSNTIKAHLEVCVHWPSSERWFSIVSHGDYSRQNFNTLEEAIEKWNIEVDNENL